MAKNPIAYMGLHDGDFGAKISRSGVNVFDAKPLETLFSTDAPIMGVAIEGSMTVTAGNTGTFMFPSDFGYIPFVLVTATAGPEVDAFGIYSGLAGFAAIFPGPTFTQVAGYVTNVFSDRLTIRNIYNDAAQTFGITVFYQSTE